MSPAPGPARCSCSAAAAPGPLCCRGSCRMLLSSSGVSHHLSQSCVSDQSRPGGKPLLTFRAAEVCVDSVPAVIDAPQAEVVSAGDGHGFPEGLGADPTAEPADACRKVRLCHVCVKKDMFWSTLFFRFLKNRLNPQMIC